MTSSKPKSKSKHHYIGIKVLSRVYRTLYHLSAKFYIPSYNVDAKVPDIEKKENIHLLKFNVSIFSHESIFLGFP